MAKRTWKGAPKRQGAPRRLPSPAASPATPVSTFRPSGDARRDSLMQQIESAQRALDRESASGFGDRSKRAAEHLQGLNKQLADYDRSGFGPRAVEIAKTAVPAALGGLAGYRIARGMGERNAALAAQNIERFTTLAKNVERLRKNTPNGIVGTKSGDKLIALVNEGFTLGGARQPFRSVPTPKSSLLAQARPLFAKAGGKFGLALFAGLAAEGVVSRFVAPGYTDDPVLKESMAITGTASIAAAATYGIKRKIDMARPGLRPAATEIAKVTAAHGQIVREMGTKPASAATLSRWAAVKAASRVLLPVAVGAAAVIAASKSAKAGESRAMQLARGVVAGANEATMGVPAAADSYFRRAGVGGVSNFIARTVTGRAGGAQGNGALGARRGLVRAQAGRKRPLARRGASPVVVSDGRVESHYRRVGGKTVFVHGYQRQD